MVPLSSLPWLLSVPSPYFLQVTLGGVGWGSGHSASRWVCRLLILNWLVVWGNLIIGVTWEPVKSWGWSTREGTWVFSGCTNSLFFYCHVSFCTADENIPAKILSYNRANRAVAILCNHQRAPPKTFEKSMMNLQSKVFWIWMVG